jgi:hypothetical protein
LGFTTHKKKTTKDLQFTDYTHYILLPTRRHKIMLENAVKDMIKNRGEMRIFCTEGSQKITVNNNIVVIEADRMNHAFQVDCFIVIKILFFFGVAQHACPPTTRG